MSEISNRILMLMEEKDLSYGELSNMTGIPKSALQRYATGYTAKIPLDRLELIAKFLNVSSAYLMGWEDKDTVTDVPNVELAPDEQELLDLYRGFSEEGQHKVMDYATDLARTGIYKNNNKSRMVSE